MLFAEDFSKRPADVSGGRVHVTRASPERSGSGASPAKGGAAICQRRTTND